MPLRWERPSHWSLPGMTGWWPGMTALSVIPDVIGDPGLHGFPVVAGNDGVHGFPVVAGNDGVGAGMTALSVIPDLIGDPWTWCPTRTR